MEELLDDHYLQDLKEERRLHPAWYSRLFAALVDSILWWGIFCVLMWVLPAPYSIDIAVHTLLLLIPAYKILTEGLTGYTLGKLIIGFQVVADDGKYSPITLRQANRRFLLAWPMYLFPFIVLGLDYLYASLTGVGIMSDSVMNIEWFLLTFALVSAASYLFHPRQQAWYDQLAGTICITYKNV